MTPKTIALYATDSMSDWEYAYLTTRVAHAEAINPGHFELVFVGDSLREVHSLGGLPIKPTLGITDLPKLDSLVMLVIPGANSYDTGHEQLATTIGELLNKHIPIAAICGATYLLARAGFLDQRTHTSNDKSFLAMSGYNGGAHYQEQPVITDHGITTAPGIEPIPFTAEIMRILHLMPESVIATWEKLNTTKDSSYFYQMMEAQKDWKNSLKA